MLSLFLFQRQHIAAPATATVGSEGTDLWAAAFHGLQTSGALAHRA